MINIKNVDLNKFKIDEKSSKNIDKNIGWLTVKNVNCAKINSVNRFYLY